MTESEIYAVLDEALPGRAFLMVVPMDVREPYVVFQRISQTPQNTMDGYAQTDLVRYQIDSYARTHRDALMNMEAVLAALRACPDPPNVENEQDLYEQDTRIHRTTIDISTWYEPEKVTQ
ncbi:tail completion protein gp17 [Paraburkholderia sp. MM5477-R1]|uniref:tail completion protein gp17 n=1 Tax=Paraburkholderia sp. MM5477-R1 TaxID=2991062 RepID=UPI003D2180F6